jgi:hypothetical protein
MVEVPPPQSTHLATARAGDHRQPDEHPPVRVAAPRLGDQARRFLGRRGLRIGRRHRRRLGLVHRVRAHPPPPHRALVGTAEHVVNLADRRRAQWPAPVWSAPGIALVRVARPVVHTVTVAAVLPAPPHLCVQRVQDLGVDRTDLGRTDERADVLIDVLPVALDRPPATGVLIEVAVQQLVDGGRRPRVAPLPDVGEEAETDPFGALPGLRAGRHRLDEAVPALRDRVLTGVDPHAQGPAREQLDVALVACTRAHGLGHDRDGRRTRATNRATTEEAARFGPTSSQVRWVETKGIEPSTPALQRRCSAN